MPKWKVQGTTYITCEPIVESYQYVDPITGPETRTRTFRGCRFVELYDILLPRVSRVYTISAIFRVCSAHAVASNACLGKLKWFDGTWLETGSFLAYNKRWFLWLNHQEWLARVAAGEVPASEPMPATIQPFGGPEPTSPRPVVTPSAAEQADLEQIYTWNKDHNDRFVIGTELLRNNGALLQTPDRRTQLFSWRFEGAGDTRVFFINSLGQLNAAQVNDSQGAADLQFGPGKVVVEG